MSTSERKQDEYYTLIEENKKQKKKIDKLTIQIEKDYNERKELANKQMQDVNIKFELEEKVIRLKNKVKNLKMEIKKEPLSSNSIGDNRKFLLEISRKTDNNFNCVEDIISFLKELQEYKNSNNKKEFIRNSFRREKYAAKFADELEESSLDTIDKYKSENQKLKSKIKEKNEEIDNFIVELEIAKSYQGKLIKSKSLEKEKDKKLDEFENKLETSADEIKKKDKKISELENKINSIREEASSNDKTVDKIRDANKSLKIEKLAKDKIIETLKKEKQNLIKAHEEGMAKKQLAMDAIRAKLDNAIGEKNDLEKTLETVKRENQAILANKNTELEEKDKDLGLSKMKIQKLESEIREINAVYKTQKIENEIKDQKIEKLMTEPKSYQTENTRLRLKKNRILPPPPGAKGIRLPCPNCQIEYLESDVEKHFEECCGDF